MCKAPGVCNNFHVCLDNSVFRVGDSNLAISNSDQTGKPQHQLSDILPAALALPQSSILPEAGQCEGKIRNFALPEGARG